MKEIKLNLAVTNTSLRARTPESFEKIKAIVAAAGYGHQVEVTVHVHDPRQEWIDKYYNLAKRMANAGTYIIKHCKEVCYVIPCGYAGDAASATPRHGDKYDYKTGVAVAFAKAFGDRVPDCI